MDTNDEFIANLRNKAISRQREMKNLSDERVMEIHWDQTCKRDDAVEYTASLWECQRRQMAAGWIWKRLFNKSAYEKWVLHLQRCTDETYRRMVDEVL